MRPHDQDSALLQNSSRENAQRAALSVLCAKSEHACESLRFACSSGDLRWAIDERNNDGDGDGREKARTADGGTFARLCVRGRRKVCRAQLENILDVQRRSDTTFPIRTVHSTCMYSNATSACAQLACNMTVQHVQVCREMRWPRPSHDSWPRASGGKENRARKEINEAFQGTGTPHDNWDNLQIANFLNLTSNFRSGKYYPYRKPNDTPVYIYKLSDHWPVHPSFCPVPV